MGAIKKLAKDPRFIGTDLAGFSGLLHKIDPCVWQIAWNVNCQPVGDSEAILKYLAPYIFRVAISDSRIVAVKDLKVIFSYRMKGSIDFMSGFENSLLNPL